ncbi:hypothetical protein GLOIN_2v1728856 [Rhizophagus irregularis DAOM 181602=DAOM 197198]|uniref:Uncharacterized protein n=1 Tax=Rhizophagus irregularis (strain DAOM 181602 / DAOM 197198 / MUCL 43194) TaxID=747089 RepID=A0A2P4NZT7_RHIID|nr:hypothetical protein GLOIN_2v1728856 [Rhizophagus irregularis DAOM 181602=DAOM 197198]POG58659.1 hypothetical protein GLOIN_2v1728856 [Rhizophagus irregularis DAOM 181602=DAOM 197198]|eukprot:XP_025165525.1 hypothetical protein GLOIN_2v1728856 [Rhizophagus irregularis DAOM 181602=DAOM 197198]
MMTKYIIIQIFIQKNKMNWKFLMMDFKSFNNVFFYILNYYHLFIFLSWII